MTANSLKWKKRERDEMDGWMEDEAYQANTFVF
jgi:hypothetical protein